MRKTKDTIALQTIVLNNSDNHLALAATAIKEGEVVAVPSETVYGLCANALDSKAVEKIFVAKGRPLDNPLIVHISDFRRAEEFCIDIPEISYQLAEKFMPGPLTLVLRKKKCTRAALKALKKSGNLRADNYAILDIVTCGLDTVAVRVPSDKVFQKLLRLTNLPLAAPSANISGYVSPTTALHVFSDLAGKIRYIIEGENSKVGIESTVLDLSVEPPTILRLGSITKEQIEGVIGPVEIVSGVLSARAKSPGMKYRHYAPKAVLYYCNFRENSSEVVKRAYDRLSERGLKAVVLCLDGSAVKYDSRIVKPLGASEKEMATNIFSKLRECDSEGIDAVIIEGIEARGIGAAVVSRLVKACEGRII